jgi:hypothetical protein
MFMIFAKWMSNIDFKTKIDLNNNKIHNKYSNFCKNA